MRISIIAAAMVVSACSHPALLGRIGDDLNTASPYSLCRARASIIGSDAVNDAIDRRGIDCSQYAAEIAARRAAGMALSNSIMQSYQRPVTPIPAYQPPVRTTCQQMGYQTQCTTQ